MSKKICYRPIGIVHSPFRDMAQVPKSPANGRESEALVEIFPEYRSGLKDIEGFSHLILVFHMHQRRGFELVFKPLRARKQHGLFTTRSPNRPNPIGISVVRLQAVVPEGLQVSQIDMLDGSPVLDIKPYLPELDASEEIKLGWIEEERE